jgi:hypothetical protein
VKYTVKHRQRSGKCKKVRKGKLPKIERKKILAGVIPQKNLGGDGKFCSCRKERKTFF